MNIRIFYSALVCITALLTATVSLQAGPEGFYGGRGYGGSGGGWGSGMLYNYGGASYGESYPSGCYRRYAGSAYPRTTVIRHAPMAQDEQEAGFYE